MERIAVISDIHGNLTALESCLADIEKQKCDEIICLGDTVGKGAHSSQCVKLVRKYCSHTVMGNCDAGFSRNPADIENEHEHRLVEEYQKNMDEEDIAWLAKLPFSYELYMSGRLVRMFHAGPDTWENYTATTLYADVNEKYTMFAPPEDSAYEQYSDAVFFGHVHTQMINRLYNRTLVCVGSVGNPLCFIRSDAKDGARENALNAQYVILSGERGKEYAPFGISFHETPYDIEKELAESQGFFEYDALAYELREGKYRNYQKIRRLVMKDGIDLDNV